jgi:hypothetical protein
MKANVLLNLPKRLKLEETIKKYKKKSDDDLSMLGYVDDLKLVSLFAQTNLVISILVEK